jgi:signal transduction histidine kinase
LEAGIDSDYETRAHYIEVMMRKCDEVTGLVNDLVLHSLTELNQIVIEKCDVDMAEALQEILNDLKTPLVELEQPFEKATVSVDTKRLAQLLENLLNNAAKYTPGKVRISTKIKENFYEIHVRDWGNGIPPEDMPFITEKFYRGKNKGEQPGSGLGLYIVKHITEKMDGRLELINRQPGLEAVILLPCKNA